MDSVHILLVLALIIRPVPRDPLILVVVLGNRSHGRRA